MKINFKFLLVTILFAALTSCSEEQIIAETENQELLANIKLKSAQQNQTEGYFNILDYNIAGLAAWLSNSNPDDNIKLMSARLNNYDIVLVQEDWNYHDDLTKDINHAYQTSHSGSMGVGDGLNRFSNYYFRIHERKGWDDCYGYFDHGSDCFTPKGFTFARHFVNDKLTIDIYNYHADAGRSDEDMIVKKKNFKQLIEKIEKWSAGNAVVIAGDANSLYKCGREESAPAYSGRR